MPYLVTLKRLHKMVTLYGLPVVNEDRIVCEPRATLTLSACEQGIHDAVMRIGASKRLKRTKQMVRDIRGEDLLGVAWLIANEYPLLETDVVIRKAIKHTIRQGRQIATREVLPTDTIRPDYYQDTSDRLLELAYTVSSELDKTYRHIDGVTVTLGSLLKQGYNQLQCSRKLDISGQAVRKRIARARKQYNELFADDATEA